MKKHIVLIKAKKPEQFNYCKFGNYKDKQGRIVELIDINDQKTAGYEMFNALVSLDINQKQDRRIYEFLKDHPLIGKFQVDDVRANEEKNAEGALKSAEAITKATSLSLAALNDLAVLMGLYDEEVTQIHGRGDYGRNNAKGSLWCAYQSATAWSTHLNDIQKDETKKYMVEQDRQSSVVDMINSAEWKKLEKV